MELLRIGVILWFFLPLITLVFNRLWRASRLSKYPSTFTAQIVEASYSKGFGLTRLTYAYRVMGIDYADQASLSSPERKVGETIPIRYNPSQPAQSIVWEPTKRSDWFFLALLWLSASLGSDILIIFISLYTLVLFIIHSRKVIQSVKTTRLSGTCLFSILLLGFLLMLIAGVGELFRVGFWGQNFLRSFWNLSVEVNWNTVIHILEGVMFFLVSGVLGILFPLLMKKMGFWLTLVLLVIIMLAIIFAYVYLKAEFIDPLLPHNQGSVLMLPLPWPC